MKSAWMIGVALAVALVVAAGAAVAAPPGTGYGAHDEGTKYGTSGLATDTTGATVGGYFGGASLDGYGVWACSGRYGVAARATRDSGIAYGGFFYADSPAGYGTYAYGGAVGVRGKATNSSGYTFGGYFNANSPQGFGVYATSGKYGVSGLATATSGYACGGYFSCASANGVGVNAVASASDGRTYGLLARANSPDGYAGYFDGRVHVTGDFTVGGAKSCVVRLNDGTQRAMYAVESPGNWFEDFGKAELKDGVAVVRLAEDFAQTVNTLGADYHVFLTPRGDCEGLYVAQQSPESFEVRELRGGSTRVAFHYRIVARRLGYEKVRMKEVRADAAELAFEEPPPPPAIEPEIPDAQGPEELAKAVEKP